MYPEKDYTAEQMVRILSSLLERRTVEYAVEQADLEFTYLVLRQKRGCRRRNPAVPPKDIVDR